MNQDQDAPGCKDCFEAVGLDFDFTMAFQPIVDTRTGEIYAHEALARGLNNEPFEDVFRRVNEANRYRFDQACRVKAIKLAAELGMTTLLSINFLPNAVYRPESCIRTTLEASKTYGFPFDRIIFEFAESERLEDVPHIRSIVNDYRARGAKLAIDDFGAGFAGLTLMAELRTDIIKLDIGLIRDIEQDRVRQAIIRGIVQICDELVTVVIAEGVENRTEVEMLQSLGVHLFQGYYFALPAFQCLARIEPGRFAKRFPSVMAA